MSYKYVFFDFDGTISDSGDCVISCGVYAMKQLGVKIPSREILRTMIGPPLKVSFAKFGVPSDKIEEAIKLYREKYIGDGIMFNGILYDGITEMLDRLKAAGVKMYIATSKPEMMARDIIDKFKITNYFEYIAGASLDHSRESKSDVLRYLLENSDNTENVVMVGDTVFDVKGATDLNIPCIGVSWGYGETKDLIDAGALKVADTTTELYEMITQ